MNTTGDVGYVDDDGWLFLTDRKSFMIISGGVNIYPQETENLLVTHPKVADAAVFGVPHPTSARRSRRSSSRCPVSSPAGARAGADRVLPAAPLEAEVPAAVDFDAELPRLPTGKLYKTTPARSLLGRGARAASCSRRSRL